MTALNRIPEDSLILVCDSRKALFLANAGTPIHPSLKTLHHIEAPETAAEDSDRPGRRFDGGPANPGFHARSAMETSDPQREHAAEFASILSERLADEHRKSSYRHLIIAAPPVFLGMLRDALPAEVAHTVVSEIPKRLTDSPVGGLAELLFEEW